MRSLIFIALLALVLGSFHQRFRPSEKRKITISSDNRSFSFSSMDHTPSTQTLDRFLFSARADNCVSERCAMRVRMAYFTRSSDAVSSLGLRVAFHSIIEYRLNDSSVFGPYTPENGEVVSKVFFNQRRWSFNTPTISNVSGTPTYTFALSYDNDLFVLVATVSEGSFTRANNSYGPESIKIDIQINNYPHAETNTFLALHAKVQSKSGTVSVEQSDAKNRTLLDITHTHGSDIGLAFGWDQHLTIDGTPATVSQTNLRGCAVDVTGDSESSATDRARETWFSFNHTTPQHIDWDPSMGVVQVEGMSPAAKWVPTAALLLGALALLLA
jgi:hypothetical protein